MREYEEKLLKATSTATPTTPNIDSLSKEFTEFKSFVCQSLSLIKTQLELLALSVDKQETAMRRKVLLIHGLPEKRDEKLHESVIELLSNKMKLTDVKLDDLQVCHRLGSPRASVRPVLVRFADIDNRRLVWDTKTALKGTGITISEFLTKARHNIFTTARKHFGVKHCWSAEGKIVILLPNKTRRKIESMAELNALILRHPDPYNIVVDDQTEAANIIPAKATSVKPTTAGPPKTRRR